MEIQWNTEKRKVSDLKFWDKNPRKWSKHIQGMLKGSMLKFGIADPVIINKDNVLIAGNGRVTVLKADGKEDIDIDVRVPDRLLSEKEVEELAIKLNKISGEWDFERLLEFKKPELLDWGFEKEELAFFAEEEQKSKGDNKLPKRINNTSPSITEPGDIWQLNGHRLMCGSSTIKSDVEQLLQGEKFKLLFTSPPYNMDGGLYAEYKDDKHNSDFVLFNINVLMLYQDQMQKNAFVFWNMSYNKNSEASFIDIFHAFIKQSGLVFLEDVCWDKGHGMPISDQLTRQYEHLLVLNESLDSIHFIDHIGAFGKKKIPFVKPTKKGITNYWRIDSTGSQSADFKASFPVELPLRAINITTAPGDLVVDCFCGQGTTLIAAEKSKRKCYTMELSPEYCDLTVERFVRFCIANGRKCELLKNGFPIDKKLFTDINENN